MSTLDKRLKEIKETVDEAPDDWVGEGFHKLDPSILTRQPPRIKWGDIYKGERRDPNHKQLGDEPYFWNDKDRVEYLEKLCRTMNHAARLVQDERDQWLELCQKQEENMKIMALGVERNNAMLQAEVTKHNESRRAYNALVKELNAEIKRLKSGDGING
jgi:uncharacterized protein YukE